MTLPVFIPVESYNISHIGYDLHSQTLFVQFRKNGAVYKYNSVPPELHERFMSAPSKGHFLDAEIKGTFSFEKVQ
jgi:KTSC domain